MPLSVDHLYLYPVKGMTAQSVETLAVTPEAGALGDRRFALARGGTHWDPARPTWLKKEALVMLARDVALARLHSTFDAASGVLTLQRDTREVLRADITTPAGRAAADAVINVALGPRSDGPARLVEAGPQSFTDVPQNFVSILHLPSLRDFGQRIGRTVEPGRFRANLVVDGGAPWDEFGWLGQTIQCGTVRLRITKRVNRCTATHVNPQTAERDLQVVKLLKDTYGHIDMAVYAAVETAGTVRCGDRVEPPAASGQGKLRSEVSFYTGALSAIVKDRFRR